MGGHLDANYNRFVGPLWNFIFVGWAVDKFRCLLTKPWLSTVFSMENDSQPNGGENMQYLSLLFTLAPVIAAYISGLVCKQISDIIYSFWCINFHTLYFHFSIMLPKIKLSASYLWLHSPFIVLQSKRTVWFVIIQLHYGNLSELGARVHISGSQNRIFSPTFNIKIIFHTCQLNKL